MDRYDRASLCQKMGVETPDAWHKVDWSTVKKSPNSLQLPRPEWLFGHDPQQYAYGEFNTAAECVLTGNTYQPHNIPKKGNQRSSDFDSRNSSLYLVCLRLCNGLWGNMTVPSSEELYHYGKSGTRNAIQSCPVGTIRPVDAFNSGLSQTTMCTNVCHRTP